MVWRSIFLHSSKDGVAQTDNQITREPKHSH